MTTPSSTTPAVRTALAALAAAGMLITPVAYAQSQPATDAPPPGSISAPLDPQTLTCNDLKTQMKSSGELNLLVGPRNGWGDTFYGPGVPRCQFYQMPQFAYVKARDGRCGIGYICIDKMSID
jgi:hypothetical protein